MKLSKLKYKNLLTNKYEKKIINIDNPPILTIGTVWIFLVLGMSNILYFDPNLLTKGAIK